MLNGMQFLKPEEYLLNVEVIFTEVTAKLLRKFTRLEVEHIGASSIQGALSKGDLDILVRASKEEFPIALLSIQQTGFSIKEDTLRTEQLCMLESKNYDIDVAIQLIEKGSKFEMFTKFREALNADPSLVERYNQLKFDSIGLPPQVYRQKKSQFIEEILSRC